MLPNEILSPLILNTCRRFQGQPAEKLHDEIMRSIETAETVMGVLGNAVPNQTVAPNRADLHNSGVSLSMGWPNPGVPVAVPPDSASSASMTFPPNEPAPDFKGAILIDAKPDEIPLPEGTIDGGPVSKVRQYWTTQEIIRRLQEGCPARLKITPKLVGKEIELIRFIQSPPGGADGFPVRLQYHQRQDDHGDIKIGPELMVSPDEKEIDPDKLMRQIVELAHGTYTATQRKVEPRMPVGGMTMEEADEMIRTNNESGIPHDAADESHLISDKAKITTDRRDWDKYAGAE